MMPSDGYATAIAWAAITTGGVIAIVVGAVTVIAGAFYAVVNVQGERIKETRTDIDKRVSMLDGNMSERLGELGARLEEQVEALGVRLESQIEATGGELVA